MSVSQASLPQERAAKLWLSGWSGLHAEAVIVVGETPKRYRIRVERPTKIGGRNLWLKPGATALVPKHSVGFDK